LVQTPATLQMLPVVQVPQLPPQPLSPQVLPVQLGVQTQVPLWQVLGAVQVPQLPPQPSSPQVLPAQLGAPQSATQLQLVSPPSH
jgi:hypothetical protein